MNSKLNLKKNTNVSFCLKQEDGDLSITYIDESNLSDDPVIILASGDGDELNLPNNRSLVVVQEVSISRNFSHENNLKNAITTSINFPFQGDDNFISCGLELDENSTFVQKS